MSRTHRSLFLIPVLLLSSLISLCTTRSASAGTTLPARINCPGGGYYDVDAAGIASNGSSCAGDLTIDNSVTSIAFDGFNGAEDLSSVTLPDSVTSIGPGAFGNTEKLKWEYMADSVTSIGRQAFNNSAIVTARLSNNLTSIPSSIFYASPNLSTVNFPPNITSIGDFAFASTKLSKVVIPDSVSFIDYAAFISMPLLTELTLPRSLTVIPSNVFTYSPLLSKVVIPNSVTTISDNSFLGDVSLKNLTIPNSVTNIGGDCIIGCENLNSTNPISIHLKLGKSVSYTLLHCNIRVGRDRFPYGYARIIARTLPAGLTITEGTPGNIVISGTPKYLGTSNPTFREDSLSGTPTTITFGGLSFVVEHFND